MDEIDRTQVREELIGWDSWLAKLHMISYYLVLKMQAAKSDEEREDLRKEREEIVRKQQEAIAEITKRCDLLEIDMNDITDLIHGMKEE